uniref:Uncharacterized protein n=1 Tax=Dictyoglomus turgidum TaxID=513050 RepID=A0A7C3SQX2_9BACT
MYYFKTISYRKWKLVPDWYGITTKFSIVSPDGHWSDTKFGKGYTYLEAKKAIDELKELEDAYKDHRRSNRENRGK